MNFEKNKFLGLIKAEADIEYIEIRFLYLFYPVIKTDFDI